MANPIRNIRIADAVWKQAKRAAVDHDMSLQDWVTCALLKAQSSSDIGLIHVDYDKHETTIYGKDGNVKVSA